MKGQIEKNQILGTYVLLAQELKDIYLRNRAKSSTIKLGKEFLLNTKKRIFTEFIISLMEKSIKPKMLI